MPFPWRANAVPLPCRATKGLECVFPIWFTQCGRVWFTLAMPCPCHAPTMLLPWKERHGLSMAWAWVWHGKASVNQTRPRCVNQMGKTNSKTSEVRQGKAGERHGPQHSMAVERRPCCAVALRRTAWSEHGKASVNQTRPHCVNQIGKTYFKPLAARHGRGTAWQRNGMGAASNVWIGLTCGLEFWQSFLALRLRRSLFG